jgi:NAD(P)H-flavin reductase
MPDHTGFEIVRREDFSDVTYLLAVRHPALARAARPGQFVIVMSHPEGERIPLTIADFDPAEGTVTLVIQAVGKSTREMQATCTVGAHLHALVGPMGVPTHLGGAKKVVCVGGGLGVAPVFPQARAFRQQGAAVIGVIGFRTAGLVFWEDRFRSVCDEVIVCTDDGSAGLKGFVSDGLSQVLAQQPDVDQVVAIGPPVMMRACADVTRPKGIRTMVSLNPIMVDGTGMCGGCRVKVGETVKFACVDGPDFDGHLVDFDDLVMRLRRYREEEQTAMRRFSESCRMRGLAAALA